MSTLIWPLPTKCNVENMVNWYGENWVFGKEKKIVSNSSQVRGTYFRIAVANCFSQACHKSKRYKCVSVVLHTKRYEDIEPCTNFVFTLWRFWIGSNRAEKTITNAYQIRGARPPSGGGTTAASQALHPNCWLVARGGGWLTSRKEKALAKFHSAQIPELLLEVIGMMASLPIQIQQNQAFFFLLVSPLIPYQLSGDTFEP